MQAEGRASAAEKAASSALETAEAAQAALHKAEAEALSSIQEADARCEALFACGPT